MDFQAKVSNLLTQRSGCAIVPVFTKHKMSNAAAELNSASDKLIARLIKQGELNDSLASTLLLPTAPAGKAERVLLAHFGDQKGLSARDYIKVINKIVATVKSSATSDVSLYLEDVVVSGHGEVWKAQQVAKAFANAHYSFTQMKSKATKASPLKKGLYNLTDNKLKKSVTEALQHGCALASGMALARDLGNLPGNVCTPLYLSQEARKLAKSNSKLSAKILGEKQMRELKMGSLLSVGHGSDEESQLIILEYKGGKKTSQPIVLVGKGVTFDTGGISLKPGAGMDEMKYDMCGAASVLGTLKAVVELELPINLVVVVAAAENMPSGRATKPGDIVKSMSGQTIEVLNTDAEGRLVLCDALSYVTRYKPKAVVDVATLTGACVIALGSHATGLYSNDEDLAAQLLSAGEYSQDRAWRMPLWDEYQSQLDSNFADIANIGGREAGSVTAACFLSRFVDYPWAHLDIAGTAWLSGSAKGATGRPVGLLLDYLIKQA